MNSQGKRGTGAGSNGLLKEKAAAIGALLLPCLAPEINSVFQFFLPGAAAHFLNDGPIPSRLFFLLFIYVIASLAFLSVGMVASAMILTQAVIICGLLMIAAWRAVKAPETLILMSIVFALTSLTIVIMAYGFSLPDAYQKMVSAMTKEYDNAVHLYRKGAPSQVSPQLDQLIESVRQTLISYFPSIIGSFFIFLALSNILTFMKLNDVRERIANLHPSFDRWQMPWWLVWCFIVTGFMALVPQKPWADVGKNLVVVTSVFYLIQGFSIMKFFFKVMNTPVYVRYLVYALIGIQWYGLLLVVFTGLMDNWFDFRSRLETKMNSQDGGADG